MNIQHDISYSNLDKFEELKPKFEEADVLIIQPVQQYDDFKIENLKKILKKDCLIIRIPFIRFRGFWPDSEERTFEKFDSNSVMFFPRLENSGEVDKYISGKGFSDEEIERKFNAELNLLREMDKQSDVEFLDYFIENYKKIPMFNDPYHPTWHFICYLTQQIFDKITAEKKVELKPNNFEFYTYKVENVYFKPITSRAANVLGLKYDLDSYYIESRKNYLSKILDYENNAESTVKIINRNQLMEVVYGQ